ncbi:Uncharacterised protein [Vibrio cholerae]|nr:Uncharacterised protein [Vibrio cholerae]
MDDVPKRQSLSDRDTIPLDRCGCHRSVLQ